MPALPAVSKVIRFDLRQTFNSNARVFDRFFLQYSGALSLTDLATVLTTVRNAWNTNMAPNMSVRHTLTSVQGTDLSSATSAQATNSTASVGTQAGTDLAAGTALVIQFKIARRYRGGHPRFYVVSMQQPRLADARTWSGATITALASAFGAFIAASVLAPPAAVGTLSHVNVRYFSGFHNVTLPSGRVRSIPTLLALPTVDAVNSYVVNPIVASQRRRNQQSV